MATARVARRWNEDEFTASAGQVTFILSQAPKDLASLSFVVNGIEYDDASDYAISGVTITWLNIFTMVIGDKVLVKYL